jgi:hypothetical protein
MKDDAVDPINPPGRDIQQPERPQLAARVSPPKGRISSGLGFSLLAPILLIGTGYVLSRVVTRGDSFGDARFLFLETRPRLFECGVLLSLVSSVALIVLLRRVTKLRLGVVACIVPLLIMGIGLVITSLKPGSTWERSLAYDPTPRSLSTIRYVLPILFPNGKESLTTQEKARIRESIQIYSSCGLSEMRSVGFASSTQFHQPLIEHGVKCDSDCQNMRLANRRAAAVSSFIKDDFGLDVPSPFWNSPSDMFTARRLVDMKEALIDSKVEPLNRRAELSWEMSGCR